MMVRLLLHGGDTMLGRAVQLTLPVQAPREERIRDSTTAENYLRMALRHDHRHLHAQCPPLDPSTVAAIRRANADGSYLWGDYSGIELDPAPDLRVLNLETAVTASIANDDVPNKGINYHLHSDNLPRVFQSFACATFSGSSSEREPSPFVVSLANNHSLDFGRLAFECETLPALERHLPPLGGRAIGAGKSFSDAARGCCVALRGKRARVRCVALTSACAGTPESWSATSTRSGLVVLPAMTSQRAVEIAVGLASHALRENARHAIHESDLGERDADGVSRTSGRDIVVLSIHWGPNWAYRSSLDRDHQRLRQQFAHRVIAELGVDVLYGHSSHHVRGLELFRGKLIIYGAGDLVNDYEGFASADVAAVSVCSDIGALFVVDVDSDNGSLSRVALVPMRVDHLQLRRVLEVQSARHLCAVVNDLSVKDAGYSGDALLLRVEGHWHGAPGGPVLVYDHFR